MSRFLDYDQPIFFTPPSGKESGPRRLYKGGGGGGSGTPYYAQQDRLFGTQADISQQLYNQYASQAPTYLANSQNMVDDAMDGTLASQMRGLAGSDAAAANGASWAATNRNMQRMGAGFSTDRMLSESNKNSVMGAANTTGALNNATRAAEDMKWNRNANAYGQIAGMGSGAMAGMGSAGAGYGAMGNAAQLGSMANAQGFGKFGSAIAGIGLGYACGGMVKRNKFASGAYVRKPFVNYLKPIDWRNQPTTAQDGAGGSAVGSIAMGAAPVLLALAAKDLMGKDSRILKLGSKAVDGVKSMVSSDSQPKVAVSSEVPPYAEEAPMTTQGATATIPSEQKFAVNTGLGDTPGTKPLDGIVKDVTKTASTTSANGDAYLEKAAQAESERQIQEELARKAAEEEAQRLAAEQATSSSADGFFAARGGFIKRGVKMATGGFAQQIGGDAYETDPDRFRGKPLSAAEQIGQRAQAGLISTATNPMTYVRGYEKYQKLANAEEAKSKSLIDANPETPGVAESSAVEAPATVQEMPLAESPAMTDQEQFSQAFNDATAPQEAAPQTAGVEQAAAEQAAVAEQAAAVDTAAAEGAGAAASASDAVGSAADGAGAAVPVVKGIADIVSGRDPGEAVADAAMGYGGAQAGAMIGSAAGPVGTVVGGVLGGLLGGSIFADGGDVEREDFTPGGEVSGPGSETSDDIPAWLSDGEIVHNAEAVKLAGKDSMLAINEAGLAVRDGKATPAEAQEQIGQVMIERGKELAGGSRFVKRGVKLSGGGFLGGNLGVALGSGVDQYNLQSARNQQKEQWEKSHELQKANSERLQKIADQQAVEFENRQKDRADAETLKKNVVGIGNKYQTIGKDADQYIAKETAANEAAATAAGVQYEPLTPEQQAVIKQSVSKGADQEYIDAFRGAGQLEAATALEGKRDLKEAGKVLGTKIKDPVLAAVAELDPVGVAKADANARLRALYGTGGGRSGSSSRSSSGSGEKLSEYEKNARETIEKALPDTYSIAIGADKKGSVTGTELRPLANTFFAEILAGMDPRKITPATYDRAAMQAIGMAKTAAGGDGDYRMKPDIDPVTGKYKVQVANRNDAPEATIYGGGGTGVSNPTDYMVGTPTERQAALSQMRARAAKLYADTNKADIYKMASMTPQDIEAEVEAAAKKNPKIDKQAAREIFTNYVGHAKEYALLNPNPATKKEKRTDGVITDPNDPRLSKDAWFYGNYPTDLTNESGTPNVLANGINSVRNWAADKARGSVLESEQAWGTQRKW